MTESIYTFTISFFSIHRDNMENEHVLLFVNLIFFIEPY